MRAPTLPTPTNLAEKNAGTNPNDATNMTDIVMPEVLITERVIRR